MRSRDNFKPQVQLAVALDDFTDQGHLECIWQQEGQYECFHIHFIMKCTAESGLSRLLQSERPLCP